MDSESQGLFKAVKLHDLRGPRGAPINSPTYTPAGTLSVDVAFAPASAPGRPGAAARCQRHVLVPRGSVAHRPHAGPVCVVRSARRCERLAQRDAGHAPQRDGRAPLRSAPRCRCCCRGGCGGAGGGVGRRSGYGLGSGLLPRLHPLRQRPARDALERDPVRGPPGVCGGGTQTLPLAMPLYGRVLGV